MSSHQLEGPFVHYYSHSIFQKQKQAKTFVHLKNADSSGMKKNKDWSSNGAVHHTSLWLENYAQIYAYIQRIKHHKGPQPPNKSELNRVISLRNISEVLRIHGLSRHNMTREDIMQRMPYLDVFDPHRRTIGEEDSGPAELPNIEEVEEDLAALGWLGCPLNSVKTFAANPGNEFHLGSANVDLEDPSPTVLSTPWISPTIRNTGVESEATIMIPGVQEDQQMPTTSDCASEGPSGAFSRASTNTGSSCMDLPKSELPVAPLN